MPFGFAKSALGATNMVNCESNTDCDNGEVCFPDNTCKLPYIANHVAYPWQIVLTEPPVDTLPDMTITPGMTPPPGSTLPAGLTQVIGSIGN